MIKTAAEIYSEMKEEFERETSLVMNDGCDMSIRMYALAAQLYSLWVQAGWLQSQCFPQTAEGKYLDNHAEVRGLRRHAAIQASGILRFAVNKAMTVDLTIESGTVCSTAAGVEFQTAETVILTAGNLTVEVAAVAVRAGIAGNVPAGSIVSMVHAPVGVASCINPERFSGGVDEESDTSLRDRILDSYKRLPNGANAAYYESQALGVEGVTAVAILPKNRGIGTVDVVVASDEGVPDTELLQAVKDVLDAQREICVDIAVLAPVTTVVDVAVSIATGDNGFTTVKNAVEQAIRAFFNGKLLGYGVLKAQLGNLIFQVEGVENYSLSTPDTDLSASGAVLPVLGTLTITEME